MGFFDLRCCVSGLSTLAPPDNDDDDGTCSMLLLERTSGGWRPFTPPVSGVYNRVGSIELWPRHAGEHPAWVGTRLRGLWDEGALVSDHPDWFEDDRDKVTDLPFRVPDDPPHVDVVAFLSHASSAVFNDFQILVEDRPVRPWLAIDAVIDAIAAAEPFVGSVEQARYAIFDEGSLAHSAFAKPPLPSERALRSLAAVAVWLEDRGGWRPIEADDGAQHERDDIRRHADKAWRAGPGALQTAMHTLYPKWARKWQQRERAAAADSAALKAAHEGGEARAYSPRAVFAVGDVLSHPVFGTGVVIAVRENKIEVRFTGSQATEPIVLAHRR